METQNLFFSMDIGTRSVVGIVGYHDGDKFVILAHEIEEHKERAMYDGQVHDIELVAMAVAKVKQRLEQKLDVKLDSVSIAAAGRSLKTHKVFIERKTDSSVEVDNETISSLEIEAIQKAQMEIEETDQEDGLQYYCVGYAVVNYFLHGNIIANLEGHKASSIGIEVLATFLPKIVVDSLYSVVSRVGLEVSNLTLEPIAALNVSIQSNLRLLNIALVDIGAGTSDIALTKNGTVFAFAMVPNAGDEITEKLAETYLLDFEAAEKIKISLSKKSKIKFKDIMDISHQVTSEEVLKAIYPAVQQLAKEICAKIVEYNGKAPSAVFMVGGGSLVPGLTECIAENLQLPVERVGVRKTSIIKDVSINDKKLAGPEFITPIGIAMTAYLNRQKDFLTVTVNDKAIKLFNSKALTVADALILVGFNPRNLIGRRGAPISFILDSEQITVKGEAGEPAQIFVNGVKASLDKVLSNGDRIIIDPAVDGRSAEIYIRDYIGSQKGKIVYVNGVEKTLVPTIIVNGQSKDIDYRIQDQDIISIISINNIEDLLKKLDISTSDIFVTINSEDADLYSIIHNSDYIVIEEKTIAPAREEIAAAKEEMLVTVNGKQIRIAQSKDKMMFVDIFNYIDVDLTKVKGIYSLKLNGRDANYTDIIRNADNIEIEWEK
ncbi:MAG: actin-like ATPase involved in cell division [Clostridia bacterium]|nr:actin-like ATPase involved in cell division [Clostridia bacterium]